MVRHKLAYAYSRPAGGQRIIQGLEHQARAHVVIHGPADYLIRAHVDKRRQVRETRIRPDISDIADPQLVRLRGGELAVHQVDQPPIALLSCTVVRADGPGCTHCRPAARARRRTRRSEVRYPSSCKSHKIRSMPARF